MTARPLALAVALAIAATAPARATADDETSTAPPAASAGATPEPAPMNAAEPRFRTARWTASTALLLPAGRTEVGLIQSAGHGVSDRLEVSSNLGLLLLRMPNGAAKVAWWRLGPWQLATAHDLSYPTWLLRSFAHRGAYGLIAPDERIPHILALRNEALLTWSTPPSACRRTSEEPRGERLAAVTGILGLRTAVHEGRNGMSTIDLPVVFPRTSAYHHGAVLQGTIAADARLHGAWRVLVDATLFLTRDPRGPRAFEHKGQVAWRGLHRATFQVGYLYVDGRYPFGEQRHLLPYADVRIGFGGAR